MGLFSKHKDVAENKQAQDVKQAAVSDTQTNNLNSNSQSTHGQAQPRQEPQQTSIPQSQGEQKDFINPFTNQNQGQQGPQQPNIGQQDTSAPPFNNTSYDAPNPFAQQNDMQNSPQAQNNQAPNPFDQPNANQPNSQTSGPQDIISQSNNQNDQLSRDEITEMIDETVEKLIEEKWDSLVDNVNKILKWKETTENQIHMLKDDILNISEGFSKLENKLISKVSNYDKDILDVNSEIKALEKVFQKITPTLINNVNELSKIAGDLKGIKPDKKNQLAPEEEETKKE